MKYQAFLPYFVSVGGWCWVVGGGVGGVVVGYGVVGVISKLGYTGKQNISIVLGLLLLGVISQNYPSGISVQINLRCCFKLYSDF